MSFNFLQFYWFYVAYCLHLHNMWFLRRHFFTILIFLLLSELQANCSLVNNTKLLSLFKENSSESCGSLNGYYTEIRLLFNKTSFTNEEIIILPTKLLYFIPINKLEALSGAQLASLLTIHEDNVPIAKKILQSTISDQQRIEFLNFLVSKLIRNDEILDLIGETVYKWNYDAKDGKFQKLSNICGYTLARLWAPYVLTRNNSTSKRLLNLLTELEQKQNYGLFCNKQNNWKNLPKIVRRKWSYLVVNQSYPSPLKNWTAKQIAQYKFLLQDFNNDELYLIPFDELSQMALHDIDFDYSQARFLFSLLMDSSTLKDIKVLYPNIFLKLSPLQINQFSPEEWANEKSTISGNVYFSFAAAKQIFNKIANYWLSSKTNSNNGWTSEDLRHLPLLYTQPATSFFQFCTAPPSVQSFVAIDSHMFTDRQIFYLSGCGSILSFQKYDPKLLLGLKYMIKAIPVASLISINAGNMNYQLESYLVSLISDHNLPITLHLLNITNPVKNNYFIEDMLKNKNNALFEQLAPSEVSGSIFDAFKQLYSNYSDRIDRLPKHILNVILESKELSMKWTSNESVIVKGLYNGYTCNYIRKMNGPQFIISMSNYNMYLKRSGKVFPKNLQTCVAEEFINYLKLKSKFTYDLSPTWIYLEAWEIESIQGFVLTTLPIDIILNSFLKDNILYAIGRLSYPELMISTQSKKLFLMVEQYITHILKNESSLSYEYLFTLGNLIHFIPTTYLHLIDEQAFKFLIETKLFDTRICVDSFSKDKWAELIIKAFGYPKNWLSDTLITLSDLLIVLNQDQLNSIPKLSRLSSADIIQTRYTEEIEWYSNNIPFYKGCKIYLDDQNFVHFTNSLSILIDFHLTSIQNQLQMISPINYNQHYENIIMSSEAQSKMFKPTVLIPIPEINNILKSQSNSLNNFFFGKEKKNLSLSTKEHMQVTTTSITEKIINTFPLKNDHYINNTLGFIFTPSPNAINNYIKISDVSNNTSLKDLKGNKNNYHEKLLTTEMINLNNELKIKKTTFPLLNITEKPEYNKDIYISSLDNINEKHLHNNKYDVNSTNSVSEEFNMPIMDHNTHINKRKKRSFEPIFNFSVQISCDALKILGSASVTSIHFNAIVYSMNNEELENCVDLLGSFDIDIELAQYIWSKIKDKAALHTYGSVLSGLSIDDIKAIDLDINKPWSLELINLLSKYVKTDNIRKEIIKKIITKSKSNMPSHLWGSIGSLICQLQPHTFKMIMSNKELIWKMSTAFNTTSTCNTPCIKNLASVVVSVIGPSNLWKTTEVEHMGIIISGINITQWKLLLKFNPEALEGLSTNTIKCLNEQQIKVMNETHLKYLTPKSAYTLLESHSKLLDYQNKEKLIKLVNFELKIDWQPIPKVVQNIVKKNKYFRDNNSNTDIVYAFAIKDGMVSNEMPAVSNITINHVLSFSSILSTVLLYIFLSNNL